MTNAFPLIGKLFLPVAAVSLSVVGMTAGTMAHQSNLPLTCQIAVETGAYGPTYKGIVTASERVDGTYTMKFSKTGSNSASINQSGAFDLAAGESTTVGQASLGRSGKVEAELTVVFDGTKMICRTPGALDL